MSLLLACEGFSTIIDIYRRHEWSVVIALISEYLFNKSPTPTKERKMYDIFLLLLYLFFVFFPIVLFLLILDMVSSFIKKIKEEENIAKFNDGFFH